MTKGENRCSKNRIIITSRNRNKIENHIEFGLYNENGLDILSEGHDLVAVELGHTDTDHTTCLNVPSVGL
jgi:hypothetical protein